VTTSPAQDYDQLARDAGAALGRQDAQTARLLFGQMVKARPSETRAWHGLAQACRSLGDDVGQVTALDRLLEGNPNHVGALIMKADFFARNGDGRAAHAFYEAAIARAGPDLSAELRTEVQRARQESRRYAKSYEDHLRDALADAGFDQINSSPRFGRCLDMLFGRSRIFLQSPTAFYFPELPQRQFYEREEFPWLAALEARTDMIREELLGVLADEARAFSPYVQSVGNRPRRDYGDLLDNPGWSAFYLVRSGEVVEEAAQRCPGTLKALGDAPLTDAPGRTPSVLFSLLRPGVRIPPHTGYTNARLICHLPLIVPEGCGLRVGNETRGWTEGKALIFDDSIEHEAWNSSASPRVVLLFDIWRPELTDEERKLVAATLAAVGSYGNLPAWD
jgi:aspartyl/asparaginyl beta-hydroxylase (cupin superfamily)